MRELVRNGAYNYRFFASLEPVAGIKAFQGDETVKIEPLKFRVEGKRWILKGYWTAVFDRSAEALVILGNPNMPATWLMAVAGRLMGKKIFFWSHGWLRPERVVKRIARNFYFSLAHRVLVYGERAEVMAGRAGFNPAYVRVVYNSLDFAQARQLIAKIEAYALDGLPHPQSLFPDPTRPLVICTARLTELCRFDLLFDAASQLKQVGKPLNILLVGDGPARNWLEVRARELEIEVHFYGACYEEDVIANLIYHSDLTISPGKIGLTVIHSLTYGTPAITHSDLDEQMPEVEAIEPGRSGLLFERNNVSDLVNKIDEWLQKGTGRDQVRRDCQRIIAEKWNPTSQRRRIEAALAEVLPPGRERK